jgi:ATP synthase protein I
MSPQTAQHPVMPLVRAAVPVAGITAVVAVAVSVVAAGTAGLFGSLLGVALAVVYLGISLLVGRLTMRRDPNVMMAAAMASFLLKLIVLMVVLRSLQAAGVFETVDGMAFALTAAALALATAIAEAVGFARARRPVWDTPMGKG